MIQSLTDLTDFLRRFHRDRLPDPRLAAALIPSDLPAGLRYLYREVGALIEIPRGTGPKNDAPFRSGDNLLPLGELQRNDGTVEFAREVQGVWRAFTPLNAEDPPVFLDVDEDWRWIEGGYRQVCESLNHFLTTLCLHEAVMSCRYLTYVVNLHGHRPAEAMALPVTPLWTNGWYVYGKASHDFYQVPGEEILVMENTAEGEFWIGCQENCLERVLHPEIDYLGVKWE